AKNAHAWNDIRSLQVEEAAVEAAMLDLVGGTPFDALLDIGTGTGRVIALLDGLFARAVGVDQSHAMLAIARAELDRANIGNVQIRQGDIYSLALPRDSFDLITIHQVLHYLDDPARAIREAARVLRPGGRMLITDLAPHAVERLRDEHAHRRLGFSHGEIARALAAAGLDHVTIRDVPSPGSQKLGVTLWLAKDQRFTLARTQTPKEFQA
ncbi:MAG: class I SAM-dependent methyltransferase, partial [Ancalomicrobiaceae bacterium]|nr:class I SAM-dependent methyltransferase [Ancalomicrobiaceae bacterium]